MFCFVAKNRENADAHPQFSICECNSSHNNAKNNLIHSIEFRSLEIISLL